MKQRRMVMLAVGAVGAAGAAGAVVLVLLAGMSMLRPGVRVSVKNAEPAAIEQVRVLAGGQVLELGAIAPGGTAGGWIIPAADSAATVEYVDAAGNARSVAVDTYLTAGLRGQIEIELREGQVVQLDQQLR